MSTRRPYSLVPILAAGLILGAVPARAGSDLSGGARVGYYAQAGAPFLGGELLFRVAPSVYLSPSLEVVFKEDSFFAFSGDVLWEFLRHRDVTVAAGAGLGILAVNPPDPGRGDTSVGLDLLFRVGFPRRSVTPYVQAKVIAKEDGEFCIGVGLRF